MGEDWQEVPSRNHRRSNADDVSKVAKSVFVTNFPESVLAQDLWKSCSVYGKVVDVFIPSKKSKAGKRFAFVRFIKSFSAPTANAAEVPKKSFVPQYFDARPGSYANVGNGASPGSYGSLLSTSPVMVLEDTCLVVRKLSKHVMGKVKDFTAIPRLYTILKDEGFLDVKLNYLRGTWVLFEFCNNDTKVNFMNHIGINSWFQVIQDASPDFISDERIVWMDIEGIHLWPGLAKRLRKLGRNEERRWIWKTTKSVYGLSKRIVHVEEESNFVPNNNDPNNHINEEVDGGKENSKSEDPFGIYDMLSNKKDNVTSESRPSLSHPPGFTLEGAEHHEMLGTVNREADNNRDKDNPVPVSARVMNTSQDIPKEMHSDSVGSKTVHNGGSMLGVIEDFIQIDQAMGYAIEGSVNDLATIIGQQGDDNVIR
nr:hypothetical protein [Tanacetum cinerariifolium]